MIPLTNSPNQTLTAELNVDGAPLSLNLNIDYDEMAAYWVMSISDVSGNLLIASIPLVTGGYPAANLLQQQRYLGIGSCFIVNVSNLMLESGSEVGYGEGQYGAGPYGGGLGFAGVDYPDKTNLGTDFQLWWDDTPSA